MMNRYLSSLVLAAGIAVISLGSALPVSAQGPAQFASFTQATPLNVPFRFINSGGDGSGSVFGLYDAGGTAISIPVNFQFQIPNDYGTAVGENIAATMTMTSAVLNPDDGAGRVNVDMQNINVVFTADTPVNGLTNLLTMSLTTGVLSGQPFTSTVSLEGTQSATSPDIVNFTSDFLDFSGVTINKNYSLSFSNVQPIVAREPNNYFRSFVSSGSGTFGSEPLPTNRVPEPGTLALLALGMLGGGTVLRRKARA
jgi:hypothetical protein